MSNIIPIRPFAPDQTSAIADAGLDSAYSSFATDDLVCYWVDTLATVAAWTFIGCAFVTLACAVYGPRNRK